MQRAQFPSLNPGYVGGITQPAGQVEPYKFTLSMAQAAETLGAKIVQGELVGFATQGDRITGVRLASGSELQADAVVLAMGPWTGQGSAVLDSEIGCRPFLIQCLRASVPGACRCIPIWRDSHRRARARPRIAPSVASG